MQTASALNKFISFAGLAVVLLFVMVAVRLAPNVESHIKAGVDDVMEQGSFVTSSAEVDGRVVVVTGAVPDQSSGRVLLEGLRSVPGVKKIRSEFVVAPDKPLVISKTGRRLNFRGVVTDYRARDFLISYAREIYGSRNVIDATVVTDGDDNLTWPNMVRTLIEQSEQFQDVEFVVSGKVVSVRRSEETSASQIEGLRQRLESDFVLVDVSNGESTTGSLHCLDMVKETVTRRPVTFSSGTAEPSQEAVVVLKDVAQILQSCPDNRFMIAGHTDASGNENANVILSQQRAAAVARVLRENGLNESRMEYVGRGSAEPVADNETTEGKEKNRRIEFIRLD